MRELTEGLRALRDALARILADQDTDGVPWEEISEWQRDSYVQEVEELLDEDSTAGLLSAVDTLLAEGFRRGASPAVGVLLAELGGVVPATGYLSGYQDGLARAVEILMTRDAEQRRDAYELGFRAGRRSLALPVRREPGDG
jgi:hypothetical protein